MSSPPIAPRWELAAEAIAIKIRWLGLALGYVYVNSTGPFDHQMWLNAILGVGLIYTALDTYFSVRGQVFLERNPLVVSSMEALFIGVLCYFHGGLESRFHYYYILSLICCALRHPPVVTHATCALHSLSVTTLFFTEPADKREPFLWLLLVLVLVWVTWAAGAMGRLLQETTESLGRLNEALRENQAQLERAVAERTTQLHEAQAQLLHQEKMAAFGLLAAGIAHEVGNPLTSVSSIVQLLERRDLDPGIKEKLALASGQLQRIQGILRELVTFSRPASAARSRVRLNEVIDEALSIAKYYRGAKSRSIVTDISSEMPTLTAVRGSLVQVFLNLILNAVDATEKDGAIELSARRDGQAIIVTVSDDGHGIPKESAERLFQPYFTTKKQGTGLGLFVTRKLLAEFGGAIAYENRPGGGSVFRMELPLNSEIERPRSAEDLYVANEFDLSRR